MKSNLIIKRIYEEPTKNDGYRVLVDRLWPRGVKKEYAKLDDWLKELAPSSELRIWFAHDPKKWKDFQTKYTIELNSNENVEKQLSVFRTKKCVTLLIAAKDPEHNHAIVLKSYLEKFI